MLLPNGDISYVLIPIECEDGMESLNEFSLQNVELYLDLESVNITPTISTDTARTTHMQQDIDLNASSSGLSSGNIAADCEYNRFAAIEESINDDADPANVNYSDEIVFDDKESENENEEEEEKEEEKE